jgi:hypothetical protein
MGMGSWVPSDGDVSLGSKRATFSRSTYALTWKNLTKLLRNPPFLLFLFLLPAVQVSLFCLAFGGNPTDLPIAVFNSDSGNWCVSCTTQLHDRRSQFLQLGLTIAVDGRSDTYLASLDSSTIRQHLVASVAEGEKMVRNGDAWGILSIKPGFSEFWEGVQNEDAQKCRFGPAYKAGDEIVRFRLDSTEQQVNSGPTLTCSDRPAI